MFKVNDNYQKLPGSYLFSTIAKKVSAYPVSYTHLDVYKRQAMVPQKNVRFTMSIT